MKKLKDSQKEFASLAKSNEHILRFLSWRNLLIAQYNLELVRLLKFRTSGEQTIEALKEKVDSLVLLQLKTDRLLKLEEA